MSVIRLKPDRTAFENHRSIEIGQKEGEKQLRYCLRKNHHSKNRYNTKSLNSIEIIRGSVNLPVKSKLSNRRKLFSLVEGQSKQLFSQRPQEIDHSSKNNYEKINGFNNRYLRPDRMHTIDEANIQQKQKNIKACIQLMQGVLSEIQNKKSHRRIFKSKKHINEDQITEKISLQKQKQQGSYSKFESYVKNICKSRDDSKVIILKRAKTKSTISNNIRSTIVLNANKFESLAPEKPKQIPLFDPSSSKMKVKPYFEDNKQKLNKLQEIDFSIIDKVNQSSFISEFGKKSLIKHLQEEQNSKQKQTIDNNRVINKLKNHKKLKNLFPNDFF